MRRGRLDGTDKLRLEQWDALCVRAKRRGRAALPKAGISARRGQYVYGKVVSGAIGRAACSGGKYAIAQFPRVADVFAVDRLRL